MKLILPLFAALILGGCQTTQATETSSVKPTLKEGQCLRTKEDAPEDSPRMWVLEVGKKYYAISNIDFIKMPQGFAVTIEKVEKDLATGNIFVTDCYPTRELDDEDGDSGQNAKWL